MRYFRIFLILLLTTNLSSCIVKSPKYTTVDKVFQLKLGMTRSEVENILNLSPYDLGSYNDTTEIYRYVYRVYERRTFSFNTKPRNGKERVGRYGQLSVSFSKKGYVTNIESCLHCNTMLESTTKIDVEKIFAFVTVTLPVLLVYIGLKSE